MAAVSRSSSGIPGSDSSPSCRQTVPTRGRWLHPSRSTASWGKARLTGRQMAPGLSPPAATGLAPGLFKIPVDGGAPVRLVEGWAYNPVYSPNGEMIIYASGFGGAGGRGMLRGVRPDGTPVAMGEVRSPRRWSPPFPAERAGPGLSAQRRSQGLLAIRFRHEHDPTAHAPHRPRLLEYVRRLP